MTAMIGRQRAPCSSKNNALSRLYDARRCLKKQYIGSEVIVNYGTTSPVTKSVYFPCHLTALIYKSNDSLAEILRLNEPWSTIQNTRNTIELKGKIVREPCYQTQQ